MNEDLRRHMVQTWNNFYQTIECGDFVAVREKNDENEEVFSNEEISGNFYRGQILDEIKVEFSNGIHSVLRRVSTLNISNIDKTYIFTTRIYMRIT